MGDKEKTTPKSYQIRISQKAIKHLNDISGYISFINHQPLNAIRIADGLVTRIESIKNNPLAFKECAELRTKSKMYRTATFKSWQIVFRVDQSEIVILGILHVSQKPSTVRSLRKEK